MEKSSAIAIRVSVMEKFYNKVEKVSTEYKVENGKILEVYSDVGGEWDDTDYFNPIYTPNMKWVKVYDLEKVTPSIVINEWTNRFILFRYKGKLWYCSLIDKGCGDDGVDFKGCCHSFGKDANGFFTAIWFSEYTFVQKVKGFIDEGGDLTLPRYRW